MENNNKTIREQGLERLRELIPDFIEKDWYFKYMKSPKDIEDYKYYGAFPTNGCFCQVSTQKIAGTNHDNYKNHNYQWIDMLGALKRYRPANTYAKIKEIVSKPNIDIILDKYGDEYIIGSANHRITLAKFYEIEYITALVNEYTIDTKLIEQEKLQKLFSHIGLNLNISEKSFALCFPYSQNTRFVKDKNFLYQILDEYNRISTNWICRSKAKWYQKHNYLNTIRQYRRISDKEIISKELFYHKNMMKIKGSLS